jgi:hypothetical protein
MGLSYSAASVAMAGLLLQMSTFAALIVATGVQQFPCKGAGHKPNSETAEE